MEKFLEELYRVFGLVERADTFIKCASELSGMYNIELEKAANKQEYFISPSVKLTVIQVNLFFQEALLCVHTVLFGDTKENKEEIGLPYIISKYQAEISQANPKYSLRLEEAKKRYKAHKLDVMRNKLVAHKDSLTSGDPAVSYLNRFHNININRLKEVVDVLNGFFLSFDIPRNSGFEQYYSSAFSALKELLGKELKEASKQVK